MPHTAIAERYVDAPVREVYNQWTLFEEFPRLLTGVISVDQINDKLIHWKVNVGGVEREFDAEITDQVPDQHIAWRSISGPMHAGAITFTPDDQNTYVRIVLEWEPEGFMEKAGAVLSLDSVQLERDLNTFAEFIEERGRAEGGWRGSI